MVFGFRARPDQQECNTEVCRRHSVKQGINQKIATGALCLTAASMPFSVFVCHWSYVVFIVCWIIDGRWKEKLLDLKHNWIALLLPSFYLIHVAGMFYTENIPSGWHHLEKKAAFFLIPLTLGASTLPAAKHVLL